MGLLLGGSRAFHLHPPDGSVRDVSGRECLPKHPESHGEPHPSSAHPPRSTLRTFLVIQWLGLCGFSPWLGSWDPACMPFSQETKAWSRSNIATNSIQNLKKKKKNLSACFNSSSFFLSFFSFQKPQTSDRDFHWEQSILCWFGINLKILSCLSSPSPHTHIHTLKPSSSALSAPSHFCPFQQTYFIKTSAIKLTLFKGLWVLVPECNLSWKGKGQP